MLLAQGRYWRVRSEGSSEPFAVEPRQTGLPADLQELRGLAIEVPDEKWNLLAESVFADGELPDGVPLEFAKHEDPVSSAVAIDRLPELRGVVVDATAAVEAGLLCLVPHCPWG